MCRRLSALSWNALRPCTIPKLLMNWMSPGWLRMEIECLTAMKWIASRASAWAAERGGMLEGRGARREPAKVRREKLRMSLES